MNETTILIVIGILGVLIHSLMKAQSLQIDARKANVDFTLWDYWKNDYLGVTISFLCVFAWLLLVPEVSAKYEWLANWVRLSFFAVSFLHSYIIQTLLSQGKKLIRKEIDERTNELVVLQEEKKNS